MFKYLVLYCIFICLSGKKGASTAVARPNNKPVIKSNNTGLSCRDENNKPVDWFVLYKIPRIKEEEGSAKSNGSEFMYLTPDTASKGWTLSKNSIGNQKNMVANTLKPMYKRGKKNLWLLYNDQPPVGGEFTGGGHTKGIVGANKDGGFWLIHSVPKFPAAPNTTSSYGYPSNGYKNGQSSMCISLPKDQMDAVGRQLQFNQVKPYWTKMPKNLTEEYPQLAIAGKPGGRNQLTTTKNASSLLELKTNDGSKFNSFAKTRTWNKDLYEDLVAPALKTSLFVETWPNGPGRLGSNCSQNYKVNNVEKVQLCELDKCRIFPAQKDHSKWAVSTDKNNPWLCIGDINRATTQERRGGGTVCMNNDKAWEAYYKSIASVEPCLRDGPFINYRDDTKKTGKKKKKELSFWEKFKSLFIG